MADSLNTASILCFLAAGIFLILTIALWFVFKISVVIGDLSGRTAKRSIEKMRQENEKTGKKSYRSSEKNLERGKLTGTMHGIGELTIAKKKEKEFFTQETGLLQEKAAQFQENTETVLLTENVTAFLLEEETGILDAEKQTGNLKEEGEKKDRPPSSVTIKMLGQVMLIHTDEVI